jgi:hypothetical protein
MANRDYNPDSPSTSGTTPPPIPTAPLAADPETRPHVPYGGLVRSFPRPFNQIH